MMLSEIKKEVEKDHIDSHIKFAEELNLPLMSEFEKAILEDAKKFYTKNYRK